MIHFLRSTNFCEGLKALSFRCDGQAAGRAIGTPHLSCDRAIKDREDAVLELKQDPFLVTLRTDPRFPALLRRIGLA